MRKLLKDKPSRIVRKKVNPGSHAGGAWKVAYADFVTGMMALFIMLWIVGQSQRVKDYVGEYFRDPVAYNNNLKSGILDGINGTQSIGRINARKMESEKATFMKLSDRIKNDLTNMIQSKRLKDQVTIEIVKEGLRIELVESSEAFFFDIGTSKLKPEAEAVLAVIGIELGKLPNHIVIEGHTDSRPYASTDGYTNFELSSDRANAARRILTKSGMNFDNVDQVRGYANTMLRNAGDPYDITNRRISVVVEYEGARGE